MAPSDGVSGRYGPHTANQQDGGDANRRIVQRCTADTTSIHEP